MQPKQVAPAGYPAMILGQWTEQEMGLSNPHLLHLSVGPEVMAAGHSPWLAGVLGLS